MATTFSSPTTTSFLLHKTPQLSTFKKQTTSISVACTRISCNANISTTNHDNNNDRSPMLSSDRRNILIGIAGLSCGTALNLEGWPAKAQASETTTFPKPLDAVIKTTIPRPRKSRSKADAEDEEEVLGIKFELGKAKSFIAFDVYVNDDDEHQVGEKTDIKAQYAGSFTSLGMQESDSVEEESDGMKKYKKKSLLKLAISRLLDDLGASDDDSIDVTIVPNAGAAQSVTVSDVGIEFDSV